ncbi:hypothetical protein D8X85_13665, partial [Listeria seeligeri]|nr:hypothetical protein [Listeria seeligeri]
TSLAIKLLVCFLLKTAFCFLPCDYQLDSTSHCFSSSSLFSFQRSISRYKSCCLNVFVCFLRLLNHIISTLICQQLFKFILRIKFF